MRERERRGKIRGKEKDNLHGLVDSLNESRRQTVTSSDTGSWLHSKKGQTDEEIHEQKRRKKIIKT